MANRRSKIDNETTLRDFSGGWNASDSPYSLAVRFQPVSDNVVRGTDGSIAVRYGTELFVDLRDGDETEYSGEFEITVLANSGYVGITLEEHGFEDGDHVTISGMEDIDDVPDYVVNNTFGITVLDDDHFSIYLPYAVTNAVNETRTFSFIHDNHTMSGRTVEGRYFGRKLVVFDDIGEVVMIDLDGNATNVWNHSIADSKSIEPWSFTTRVSAEIVRGRLVAVNGAAGDKPLTVLPDGTVNYLIDEATFSNGAIPRAEFVVASNRYVMLINTEYGETKIEIGARDTVFTGSRETDPSDAVEFDVGMMTQTVENNILGAAVFRDKVFLGYHDMSMLGSTGHYDSAGNHQPDFSDNLAAFGTFAHSSIISTGNDLFCAGMNGINALEVSRISGAVVPQTISDLIHPALLPHFARLSDEDRRFKVFAVHDFYANTYMLFVPKFSEGSFTLGTDPITLTPTMQRQGIMLLRWLQHGVNADDFIEIEGIESDLPGVDVDQLNGKRKVRYVVDENTLIVEVGPYIVPEGITLGGDTITVTPVNDETICYAYEFNHRLRDRRWTRFTGLNFDWGARSQLNRLFFGYGSKIYRFGTTAEPLHADYINDYDYRDYINDHPFKVGDRVRDGVDIYECTLDHVSPNSGTFAEHRSDEPRLWKSYVGRPIKWDIRTPWTEFEKRINDKTIEDVSFDTSGTGGFTFEIFSNSHLIDPESYLPSPNRALDFVGAQTGGFGAGPQPFGGGRNTEPEWLHGIPVTGKIFQLRMHGEDVNPLKITAVTIHYR